VVSTRVPCQAIVEMAMAAVCAPAGLPRIGLAGSRCCVCLCLVAYGDTKGVLAEVEALGLAAELRDAVTRQHNALEVELAQRAVVRVFDGYGRRTVVSSAIGNAVEGIGGAVARRLVRMFSQDVAKQL
jgi:hypothetical protein